MTTIHIIFSEEFEVKRIQNTIKSLDWYMKNGYSYDFLSFPQGMSADECSKLEDSKLKELIQKEYADSFFDASRQTIENSWNELGSSIEKALTLYGCTIPDSYTIFLTRYGIRGSYHLPNEIIINVQRAWDKGLLKTLVHEALHLGVEPLIQTYAISQKNKELVVDAMLKISFPELYKSKSDEEEKRIESVVSLFNQHNNNAEEVIAPLR